RHRARRPRRSPAGEPRSYENRLGGFGLEGLSAARKPAFGRETPVRVRPHVGADAEEALVDLVEMQPASLALSFWTRLAPPRRDRHDNGTFAAVHDLELVPLAH